MIGLFFILVAGCNNKQPAQVPVARLDDRVLTLEDIKAQFDTTQNITNAQLQQIIQRWLRDELLYQEALKRGIDRLPEVERRIAEAKRQLIVNAFLEKEIYSNTTSDIQYEDVRQYYENNKKAFILTSDIVLLSYVLFKNRDIATEFRNTVLKGSSWQEALQQLSTQPDIRVDSMYFTQNMLYPQELWRVAMNIKEREVSFPISTPQGFYVLYVHASMKQGQQADLAYVEPQIRGRLLIEQRKKMYDSLIAQLRQLHSIHVYATAYDSVIYSGK